MAATACDASARALPVSPVTVARAPARLGRRGAAAPMRGAAAATRRQRRGGGNAAMRWRRGGGGGGDDAAAVATRPVRRYRTKMGRRRGGDASATRRRGRGEDAARAPVPAPRPNGVGAASVYRGARVANMLERIRGADGAATGRLAEPRSRDRVACFARRASLAEVSRGPTAALRASLPRRSLSAGSKGDLDFSNLASPTHLARERSYAAT